MMIESEGFERLKEYLGKNPDLEDVCTVLNSSDHDVREVFGRLEKTNKAEAVEILKRLKSVEMKKKD
jgi:hypothetical protein